MPMAHAQDVEPVEVAAPDIEATPAPAEEDPSPPVEVVPAPVTTQASAPAPEPEPAPPSADARERIEQAEALFAAESYEASIVEYERAYELLGGHPLQYYMLFNIGQAHERLFRYDAAIRNYQRYLEEGGPDAADRPQVQATLNALEGLLGQVVVRTNVLRAELWIDGARVGDAPAEVRVTGGRHTIELRAAGFSSGQDEFVLAAREVTEVRIELDELASGLHPAFFGIAAGATLVSAAVLAGFGISALRKHNETSALLLDPATEHAALQEDFEEAQSRALVADVFLGVTAALAAASIVLLLFTDFGDDEENERPELGVAVTPEGGALSVRWAL